MSTNKMKQTPNKGGRKNMFLEWIGEGRKPYSGEEKFKASIAFLGLITLSLFLTSGTRMYNYDHFIQHEPGFLPDSFSYQVMMFLLYASLSIIAVFFAYINSRKSRKKLMLGAAIAGVGVSGLGVLLFFFGTDFLSLNDYGQQLGMDGTGLISLYKSYFNQYGVLYLIPAAFVFLSFAVKNFYRGRQEGTSGEHGSAAFADQRDLTDMGAYDETGVIYGKKKRKFLRTQICNRTIIARSGGGKTSGIVIPALLTEKRPIFMTDNKGELWSVAARHRFEAFGHEGITIDPYDLTRTPEFMAGKPAYLTNKIYRFNPLDFIPKDDAKRDAAITALVRSITTKESQNSGKDSHFTDMAEKMLLGIIEWVVMEQQKPNLSEVHDILCLSPSDLERTMTKMQESDYLRAKAAGALFLGGGSEERKSFRTSAYRQVSWLADPSLRALVSETNFDLTALIKGKADIYIIMQNSADKEQSRVFRMLLAAIRNLMVQTPKSQISKEALLFLFEELGQLGYCEDLEMMIPFMRAYNAVFWFVFQDIGQIKKYGDAKSLFTGATMLQLFNISDSETIKWICELGGRKTYISTSDSASKGKGGQSKSLNESTSVHEAGTELIKFNEVWEMSPEEQLVFIQGQRPIQCEKVFYFKEDYFKGKYDRNPLESK